MDVFYFGSLFSCVCISAVGAHPQFYYMVPSPQPARSSFYSSPFDGNAPFQYEPAAPFPPFAPRQYDAPQLYYSTQQTFGNIPATDSQFPGYQTFTGNSFQPQYQQQTRSREEIPTNVIVSSGTTNGFVYHTQLNTGGSADVYFVMGPQVDQLRQLQAFGGSFQNSTSSPVSETAKTLASNTVDSKASDKKPQQQIAETLVGTMPGSPFDAIRSFLGKSQDGFQQLYSTSQFFGNLGQNSNQNVPANTILLSTPTSTQIFGNFPFVSSRFNVNENTVKNTTSKTTDGNDQNTTSKTTDDKNQNTTSKTTDDKGKGTTSKIADDKDVEVAESTNTEVKVPANNVTSTVSPITSDATTNASTQTSTIKDEAESTIAPDVKVT